MSRLLSLLLIISLTACAVKEQTPNSLLSQLPADKLTETRYCGPPVRDANGLIVRSSSVITAYKKIHVCPSTGLYGNLPCPGWALNHPIPLACGGCDAVSNLMYMRNDVKKEVDKYERSISALNPPIDDTANCVNKPQ